MTSSGFVIGYAYDDRWRSMSIMEFFKRRLVRLHPMIVVGMAIGALMFYAQAGTIFPKVQDTPVWLMIVVTAIGMTLIPVGAALDIRGWGEMHPLNGPRWRCRALAVRPTCGRMAFMMRCAS